MSMFCPDPCTVLHYWSPTHFCLPSQPAIPTLSSQLHAPGLTAVPDHQLTQCIYTLQPHCQIVLSHSCKTQYSTPDWFPVAIPACTWPSHLVWFPVKATAFCLHSWDFPLWLPFCLWLLGNTSMVTLQCDCGHCVCHHICPCVCILWRPSCWLSDLSLHGYLAFMLLYGTFA